MKAAKSITGTIIIYPDNKVTKIYQKLLKRLEKFHFISHSRKKLDSHGMIKQLFAGVEFCIGIEIMMHLIRLSAIKFSVKSAVESLV